MYEEQFSKRLAELRTKKGVSARDMSLSIEQNPGYIRAIECGATFPTMASFFYIYEYLNVTPQEFFNFDEEPSNGINSLFDQLRQLDKEQIRTLTAFIKTIVKKSLHSALVAALHQDSPYRADEVLMLFSLRRRFVCKINFRSFWRCLILSGHHRKKHESTSNTQQKLNRSSEIWKHIYMKARYQTQTSMLRLLAYVLLVAYNEQKTLDCLQLAVAPENIKSSKDVYISLFGGTENLHI